MSKVTKQVLKNMGSLGKEYFDGFLRFLGDLVKLNIKWILIALALLWIWDYKVDKSLLKDYLGRDSSQFKEGEVAKVQIDCRDNTLIEHIKGKEPKITSGVKTFTGSQFEDGHIETSYKNKGFSLEPGITAAAGDGLRLGLDIEYAYWKRWGLIAGTTLPARDHDIDRLRGHLGLSYDLPSRWLSSSSVWAGIDTNKIPSVGLRTRIGGGL